MKKRVVVFATRGGEASTREDPLFETISRIVRESPTHTVERYIVAQPFHSAMDWLGKLGFTRPVCVQRSWTGAMLHYLNGPEDSDYDTAVFITNGPGTSGSRFTVYLLPTRQDALEFYDAQLALGGESSQGVAVTPEMVDKAVQRQGAGTRPWKRTRHRKYVHSK